MFNFFQMGGTYESRKVARDDYGWGFISTAQVNDGSKPYETAVKHTDYNDGSMVIVENYDTKGEAQAGHAKWVTTMTAKTLPKTLVDCANADIAQMCEAIGGKMEFPRKAKR